MSRAQKQVRWQLQIIGEPQAEYPVRIRTPADVQTIFPGASDLRQEIFCTILLNAKNNLIDRCAISTGLIDGTLIHPREVFRAAVKQAAFAIILVHNHPSGDPSPSAEDIRITKQLIEAGKILDINVLDHIILGSPTNSPPFLSMKEQGLIAFN